MKHGQSWLSPAKFGPALPWDVSAVTHLLRRCAFGHAPDEVERALAAGPDGTIAALLAGETADPREQRILELRTHALRSENPEDFACWLWSLWQVTRSPLHARMQLFWHDHFATSVAKVRTSYWMAQQFAVFAEHGLGPFPVLLEAVAKTPAMLRWLDNEQNQKGRANENFARELFELFTLGRGRYSEHDIQEAARAFTGWRIEQEDFFFDARRHDDGVKQVLGHEGELGGEDVLALACAQDACPRFLSQRLLAAFVGPACPEAAVEEFAHVLREHELHVGEGLRVLLRSRLFFAPEQRKTRIRGPIEWILWLLRSLESCASPRDLHRAASRMGQALLDPPGVAGWPEEESWISTATWVQRSNFAVAISSEASAYRLRPTLGERLPRREGQEGQLQALVQRLFPEGLPEDEWTRLRARAARERGLATSRRLAGLLAMLLQSTAAHRF